MMTKKTITIATLGGITAFILGMSSGIWLATPDVISGAPQDENCNVPQWAWELCECTKNDIHYFMPDIWSRGVEDDTQDGEALVAHALEPEEQAQQAQAGMILDIDIGQPRAHVKAVIVSSTDPDDVQEVEVKADETGKARLQFKRDLDTEYNIELTVNDEIYTMTDKQSTCEERLEIVGVKGFTTPQGVECMTLDVVLKDVPPTPKEEPAEEPGKGAFTPEAPETPKDDKKPSEPDKDVEEATAPMQKPTPTDTPPQNDNTPITPISQGMPTAVAPANPVAIVIQWFLNLWV